MYILYTDSVWNKDVEAQNSIMSLSPCSFDRERRSRVSSHGSSPVLLVLGTQRLHPSLGGMAGGGCPFPVPQSLCEDRSRGRCHRPAGTGKDTPCSASYREEGKDHEQANALWSSPSSGALA